MNRNPSALEISLFLNVGKEKVCDMFNYDQKQLSIDKPLNSNSDTSLLEMVPCREYFPDQQVLKDSLEQSLQSALTILNSREHEIIQHYFGLKSPLPTSLEDIAERLELSTEHTRRIKDLALE